MILNGFQSTAHSIVFLRVTQKKQVLTQIFFNSFFREYRLLKLALRHDMLAVGFFYLLVTKVIHIFAIFKC